MLEEDLDDTHLCIKCSTTIVGLDNYVQHRKANCGGKTSQTAIVPGYVGFEYADGTGYAKSEVENAGGKSSKALSDPYDLPYELGADVFFSSLQLQSVQASGGGGGSGVGGKTGSGQQILTRKATATLLSATRDEAESEWPEETPNNNTDNLMKVVRDIGETKKFEPIYKPIAFTHESPEPEQSDDEVEDDDDDSDDDDDDEDYVPTPYCGGKWKPGSLPPAARSGGKWKGKERQTAAAEIPPPRSGGKWNFKASENSKWKPYTKPPINVEKAIDIPSHIRAKLKTNSDGQGSPESPETGGKWKPEFSKFDGELVAQTDSKSVKVPHTGGKWKSTGDHDSPDIMETHSGGKWKPGESPSTSGKWKPDFSKFDGELLVAQTDSKSVKVPHTGGKWKSTGDHDSPDIMETHSGGKWKPGESPSTSGKWKPGDVPSTSGKWKPGERQGNLKVSPTWEDQETWEEDGQAHPPVEHTKGKWVPGTKVERLEYKEEALAPPQDYWCNICCRKLKTRIIYEKHLKSSVHLRKSETEQQLERAAVEQLQISQQILQPPQLLLDRPVSPKLDPRKRKRRKTFIKCEICKHRMQRYLVGKHLISHYHYVRMRLNPAGSFGMILENIHQIVLQSPFQCRPCRFYANTEENFLSHWNSVEHRDRTEGPGKFWCSFCRFECEDNNQMRRHLLGSDHREVIFAINRSVPICISQKVTIECPKCRQGFRFNIELRQHAARCDGAEIPPIGTASDEYQSRFRCSICPEEVFKSKIALQRHEKFKHNTRHYFCSVCSLEFQSADAAIKHRKSKAHRTKSGEKSTRSQKETSVRSGQRVTDDLQCEKCDHMSSSEVEAMLHQITHPDGCKKAEETRSSASRTRKCPYCKEPFVSKTDLKTHLQTAHPEARHICPLCGETFTLAQELSSHRRYKVCIASTSQQPSTSANASKKTWKCPDCTFNSAYESELIFHRIIHTEGLAALQSVEKKLNCPLCEKSFTKHSLRHHLRQHTNEKTFECEICKRSFSRRHNYKEHLLYVHSIGGVKTRKEARSTDESFICDTCGKIFRTKYSLKLHITIHTERDKKFRCPIENCQYIGRNGSALIMHNRTHNMQNAEFQCQEKNCNYRGKSAYHLRRHMKNHLEPEKIYKCPECSFKAKIPGHIKRHVRIHTGECPYKCPHCDYSCGYIENLRKHILTTKKHPGKFIYECDKCDKSNTFKTNYNNEYQLHLTTVHQK